MGNKKKNVHSLTGRISQYICTTAWGRLLERRLTRWRMREDIPRCWQHLGQSGWKDTLSGQLIKAKEPGCLLLLPLSLSVSILLSSPRHSSNRKLFWQFYKALRGQERSTDSTLPTLYARQIMGAVKKRACLGKEEGGKEGKLLPWSHS